MLLNSFGTNFAAFVFCLLYKSRLHTSAVFRNGLLRFRFGRRLLGELRPFFRFRDFQGRYPFHCHNVVHEDHAMMLRWEIDQTGDTNTLP